MLNKTKISVILLSLSLTLANAHGEEAAFENQAAQMLSQSISSIQQKLSKEIRQELRDNIERTLSFDIQDTLVTLANTATNSENKNEDTKKSIDTFAFQDETAKKQTGE